MTSKWHDKAKQILSQFCQSPIRPFSTRDFGREHYDDAVSTIVPQYRATALMTQIREALQDNMIGFIGTTRWLVNDKPDGAEVVIAQGESQFDILAVARSNATKYDMFTGDIIKKLQEYDWLYGIDIFHAETDMVQFTLETLPDNVRAFAEDLYGFCPDIVNQGVGSVDALETAVAGSKLVYLWWH